MPNDRYRRPENTQKVEYEKYWVFYNVKCTFNSYSAVKSRTEKVFVLWSNNDSSK